MKGMKWRVEDLSSVLPCSLHNPSTDCYQVAVMKCHKSGRTLSGDGSQEFHASVYAEIVGRVRFDPFDSQ
jgi:hypothetical protein